MFFKLWSIVIILILLWVIELATNMNFGGYIHLLFITAVVTGIALFLSGRSRNSDEKK